LNKRDWIVLAVIVNYGYTSQRDIVSRTGFSLGLVNASLRTLVSEGYLTESYAVTDKTRAHLADNRPQRAVILAAGAGLRMMPINRIPKGLLQVNGEVLIERVIGQLHDMDITDITVVVGYMMEKFEYLSDRYNVRLLCNADFAARDSLHSLRLASDNLSNCYIVPCDIWFAKNPFSRTEYFSWYAVSGFVDDESIVRVNRKMELVYADDEHGGNTMLGLCYLTAQDASAVRAALHAMDKRKRHAKSAWELALFTQENKMIPYARVMLGQSAYEIKTYEQLRELDSESKDLSSRRINLISQVFGVVPDEITDISALFKGMTNRLMRFCIDERPYLLRMPGEGSDKLTNRRHEAAVYHALAGRNLSDDVVYISAETGYKITAFWESARTCDAQNPDDVAVCMAHLRRLHEMNLSVEHDFDPFSQLVYYESLRDEESSFHDYDRVRAGVMELKDLIESLPSTRCLCHIDAVSDNFLFTDEGVFLIDWEYAGMCDPHIDVAMFCLYAMYPRQRIDEVIDIYCGGPADDATRCKIYAYISVCGLLWAVWCEYKQKMGVNYGEYAMTQFSFARRYYHLAMLLAQEAELLPS
jgi:CTP:phosphocholine cytidylyltransferase-like protein/thiamine kinase-like enzyme